MYMYLYLHLSTGFHVLVSCIMYLYLEFEMLLIRVLVSKVVEKYQVHPSTNKYIVFNQKLYTLYRF